MFVPFKMLSVNTHLFVKNFCMNKINSEEKKQEHHSGGWTKQLEMDFKTSNLTVHLLSVCTCQCLLPG